MVHGPGILAGVPIATAAAPPNQPRSDAPRWWGEVDEGADLGAKASAVRADELDRSAGGACRSCGRAAGRQGKEMWNRIDALFFHPHPHQLCEQMNNGG